MLIGRRLTRVMEDNKRTEAELRAIGTHVRESGEGKALPDDTKDGRGHRSNDRRRCFHWFDSGVNGWFRTTDEIRLWHKFADPKRHRIFG